MISKKKSKAINQALYYWYRALNRSDKVIYFKNKLTEKEWLVSESFVGEKLCLFKDNIVAKLSFADPEDYETISVVGREYEQYIVAPPKLKKHLTHIHVYYHGLLLEDQIYKVCKKEYCTDVDNLDMKYNLCRAHNNHGHSKNGLVKFHSWVYRRDYRYIDSFRELADDCIEY